MLSLLPFATRGQAIDDIDLSGLPKGTQAKSLRYWFDDDGGSVYVVSTTSGNYSLDISSLAEGLHTLHYQIVDNEGCVAYISSAVFLKIGSTIDGELLKAVKLSYWFDNETAIRQSDMTGKVQMIDASMLTDGLHTIHYQALCNNGALTTIKSSIFLRLSADTEISSVKSLRYWFDDGQNVTEINYTSGVQTFDVSALVEGLHTIHCQTIDDRGGLGVPYSSIFLKMDTGSTSGTAQSIRYWFDDEDSVAKITDIANGTQVLDVSELKTGVHTLCYQLVDSNGNVSTPKTGLFMKFFDKVVADGQNRITEYQYWVNRNSQAMKTVKVSDAVNPYTLISLLPMQKEPIHSDFFQFEITNGQPMIYAKNVFHIRFHDAAGYFVDGDKPYVDYSVKQEVTDVEMLKSGVRATTERPTENAIKWYQLDAESGDSLQFKLDRAATIQLFAPSGEEVHSVSGAESVKWNGLHAKETGTFYLALHDVTATQGSTVSIDYNHIDKYAVLRQDVDGVGNGGCSTITFEGNGFRDLYGVDLYNEQGDSIHHVYIGHESDATTSVVFDFTDAVLGIYSAVFHFTGEDKKFSNLITVEEARDIELATTVTYPSTFLRGTSTTYTIKITNKGNMTAYKVPLYIYMSSATIAGVTKVNVDGLPLKSLYEFVDKDSLDDEGKEILKYFSDEIGDLHYFTAFRMLSDDSSDSITIRTGNFFVDIAPNSTETIIFNVFSSETVSLYTTVSLTHPVFSLVDFNSLQVGISKRTPFRTIADYCCEKERYECIANVLANALDLTSLISGILALVIQEVPVLGQVMDVVATTSGIASCAMSTFNVFFPPINGVICSNQGGSGVPWKDGLKGFGHGLSIVGALSSCASAYFNKLSHELGGLKDGTSSIVKGIRTFGKALMDIFSNGSSGIAIGTDLLQAAIGDTNYSCIFGNTQKKPNCPPNPGGGGGTSTMRTSRDPNEILGYVAESGSKAVKDGLTDIYYTIQFENDTVFATAPAHDIFLTDTLDVNLFDLSTYRPTKIKIGEKSMDLTGERNFISTLDMRPEINAIAQIEGTIDDKTGIVRWHISSLDPMTMEPIQDAMVGVLPINYDGSGLGEASFDISLKNDLPHGTEISNRSGNVFDSNETVMTPTWTNVVDRIAPTSRVTDVQQLSDTTASVSITATDELSGPWRYDVYVQYGRGSAWWKAAENVPIDTTATVKIYDGIDHGFYVVVTDSAGNVERKQAMREMTLNLSTTVTGDVNGDSQVGIADIVAVTSYMAGSSSNISLMAADVNGDGQVGIADIIALTDIMAGTANVKGRQSVRNKTYFIRRKTKEQ